MEPSSPDPTSPPPTPQAAMPTINPALWASLLKTYGPWLAAIAIGYVVRHFTGDPFTPPPLPAPPALTSDLPRPAFRIAGVHGIPTGGAVPEKIEALPKQAAGRGPVYRLPPGELVPHSMEAVATAGEQQDWGLAAAGVPDAWKATKGKGVKVAILDTGIDLSHPDLKDAITASKDFTGSGSGVSDVQGHGSHTAGTIAARQNGVGVVGWSPECSLVVGKVLGDDGSGQGDWIAAGIDWATAQGADVISLSLGSPTPDETIHAAIVRATSAGVIVVCAAGNDGPGANTVGYPGGFSEAVCVAAIDKTASVASFSSRGDQVLIAAPGVNILSDYPGGRLATMSGTSMATPAVSASAALWVAAHPEVGRGDRPAKFKAAIQATAKDILPTGRDASTGYGMVQPTALVAPAQSPTPTNPTPPVLSGQLVIDFDKRAVTLPPGWTSNTGK